MEFEEQSSFKLAPSRVDFITANLIATQNDQITLLNKNNILRAKRLTNTDYLGDNNENKLHAVKSENQANTAYKNKVNEREMETSNTLNEVLSNKLIGDMNLEQCQETTNTNFEGKIIGDNNKSTYLFEEKTANDADYNLVSTRLRISQDYKTNNHLDGPVSSDDTTEEVHSGQMANCTDFSSGFECDGNRFTSFTKNSTE